MNEIGIHPSVLLAWALANREAHLSNNPSIEPRHFLVAVLEILDDSFLDDAKQMDLTPELIQEITDLARSGQKQIGLNNEEITHARRGLRNLGLASLQPASNGPALPQAMLHRSDDMRAIFDAATRLAAGSGQDSFTLKHLMQALMEHLPPAAAPFFEGHRGVQVDANPSRTLGKTGGHFRSQDKGAEDRRNPAAGATSMLTVMGRDLTDAARHGKLHPVVGRRAEMTAIARFLSRTTKRNVLLVGEPGVGKTAIVEGLAQSLIQETAADFLRKLRFVQISVADLVGGTRHRGDMEERVQTLIAEALADPNVVLFLDEIHLVMKTGGGDSPMDIANILKPALAGESFRCIGATTTEEFERFIKGDAAFLRRFHVLRLDEPTSEEAVAICAEWARRIEEIQQVTFLAEAIEAAVLLSVRFIRGRSLPDKAIDLLENAAAYVKVTSLSCRTAPPTKTRPVVSAVEIQRVLEEQYGLSISASGLLDPTKLRSYLSGRVVGQDDGIDALVEALSTLQLHDLGALNRPLGVFLFTGPTGVGKTFMAESLAQAVFGVESDALLRLNMNEYKEPYDLARLAGAAPGLIGHDRPGVLFRFVESHPQGVILLDEIEKAHFEIQDYFLQIFDKAESIDSRGRKADFRQYLFVLTCNVQSGARPAGPIGFLRRDEKSAASRNEAILAQLKQHFRPEFLGRLDGVIDFNSLSAADYGVLFERQLEALKLQFRQDKGIELEIDEQACEQLRHMLGAQADGVRGMMHRFRDLVEAPLIRFVGANPARDRIEMTWKNSELVIE